MEEILKHGPERFKPRMKQLRSIQFYGTPNISNGTCKPQVDITNVRDMKKLKSVKFNDIKKYKIPGKDGKEEKTETYELEFAEQVILYGDTFIKFTHIGTLSNSKMFRISFNSNTIKGSQLIFTLDMLDPDVTKKNPNFPKDFKMTLFLEDLEVDMKNEEFKHQLDGFKVIEDCVKYHEKQPKSPLDVQMNVFSDPDFDDRDETMIEDVKDDEESDISIDEA